MEEGAEALLDELEAKRRPHAEIAVIGAAMAWRDDHGEKIRWRHGMATIGFGYTLMSTTSAALSAFATSLLERGAVALIVALKAGPGATTQTATPGDAEGHYWDDEKYRGRRGLHAIDIGYTLLCMGSEWGIVLMEVGAEALIAELRNRPGENAETASPSDAEGMLAGGIMAEGAAGDVDPLEVLRSLVRRAASELRSDNTVPWVPLAPDQTAKSQQIPAPTLAGEAPSLDECAAAPAVAAPSDEAPPPLAAEVPRPEGESLPAVEASRGEGQPLAAPEAPRASGPPVPAVDAPCVPTPTPAAEVRGTEGPHLMAIQAPRADGPSLLAVEAPRTEGPPVPTGEAPSIEECAAVPAVEAPRVDPGHSIVFMPPSVRTPRALPESPSSASACREGGASMLLTTDHGTLLNEFVEAVVARLKAEGLAPSSSPSASSGSAGPVPRRGTRSPAAGLPSSPASAWTATTAGAPSNASGARAPTITPWGWYDQDSSPIARRTYLKLCRKGTIAYSRVGKKRLVQCEVLDMWILAQGKSPALAATSPPPTPTNDELLRGAGVVVPPSSRRAARSSADPPAVAAPKARRRSK